MREMSSRQPVHGWPGIDLFRHLLALGVILQHMASSRYSPETTIWLRGMVDWVDGAVAGFFMLSGFFFKADGPFLPFVRGRAVRLLVPFLLFSTAYAVMMAGLGKGTLATGMVRTLTFQGAGMQLYFLPFLFVLCLVLWPIQRLGRWPMWLGLSLLLLAVGFLLPTKGTTGNDLHLVPLYGALFLLGRVFKDASEVRHNWVRWLVPIALLITGFWDHRFFDLAAVSGIFALILQGGRWLPSVRMPGSGGVYLLHTPIVNFTISTVLLRAGIGEKANVLFALLLTYVFCLACVLLVLRFFPRWRWLLLE